MTYKAIYAKDYKDQPVQFAGYYVLKITDDMPPPEIFFVEDEPTAKSRYWFVDKWYGEINWFGTFKEAKEKAEKEAGTIYIYDKYNELIDTIQGNAHVS